MDPVLQMLCVFSAGALVGLLMSGGLVRRVPSSAESEAGVEHELANLRNENARLIDENEHLRAERGFAGGGDLWTD